ncbi:16S rRNA (guanine(966)-N(2))-methyltransferase RsmD [Boudabousia tangfeifanii]|uniref:16S rRNA (Guanine(966)-N(2))-methyltransferase RsmD n=1 Tax=Boudabousia tangfeifanii TaxID=1912795 RepID=A0A1D9MKJ1_9ACTO|nr:16S rRNA (guanine(966)-N(2))-methyltransferase RsmD [Boudabousia tangfeifanii]AOZ72824.1 16S rRNA (guanine(966)-N(2))-methyltransferase RsmD [Boudabousia tangfeifanii]
MTRIIAGTAKGRELKVPPKGTRPTSSRVREAIFSRLDHWNLLNEAEVLDLCAGSGSLGLEAASRGAARVEAVELAAPAARLIKQNAQALGLSQVNVVVANVQKFLTMNPHPQQLVFFDPPYDLSNDFVTEVLELVATGWLAPEGVIVLERSIRSEVPLWPESLSLLAEKKYGETQIYYLELAQNENLDEASEADALVENS